MPEYFDYKQLPTCQYPEFRGDKEDECGLPAEYLGWWDKEENSWLLCQNI